MKLKCLFALVLSSAALLFSNSLSAQTTDQKKAAHDEIIIQENPEAKDACFEADKPVVYNVDFTSAFNKRQTGSVSYIVTDMEKRSVMRKKLPIILDAHDTKRIQFTVPPQKAGFYNINFLVNTTDYHNTIGRVFGVDVYNIQSPFAKPADFDQFWENTKAELAKVKPEFKVTERPDKSNATDQVFELEMKSLDNVTLRGWMTLPKNRDPEEKLSIYVVLPDYWSFMVPQRSVPHLATFSLNVRGLGNSRDQIYPTKKDYVTYNINDKNKYIYRGAIMDCIRMLDFACSQKFLDSTSISVNGAGMGAYLALAFASIDHRVTICTADNPVFNDFEWENILNGEHFPAADVIEYAKKHNADLQKILKDLEYFDLKNFVPHLKAKSIIGIGLLDNIAPPSGSMAMYNSIPSEAGKQIIINPELGHEVSSELVKYKGDWNWENLGVQKKIEALDEKRREERQQQQAKADSAAKTKDKDKDEKDVISLVEHPSNKDAVYVTNEQIKYVIELKNKFTTRVTGSLGYTVTTINGDFVRQFSTPVSIEAGSTKKYPINLQTLGMGFYKVNFTINTEDYDDTVRRVVGVDVYNLRSHYGKPVDFDAFWEKAKQDLAKVRPDFKMTEQTQMEKGNDQIYLIEMKSLGNVTIRAWLSLPKNRKSDDRFPVFLGLPGFGADLPPATGMTSVAVLNLNVRGLGNSRDEIHPGREEFLTYGIEDKNTYIYRGVLMDCMRAVDFICSRGELDNKRIFARGGSIGGYLALALASIDHRVAICSADNPAFSDFRDFTYSKEFPMESFTRYAREHHINFDDMLNTLDYYDLKNFVENIQCETVMGMGLLDQFAPPYPTMCMYNLIRAKKKLFIFPDLAHEVSPVIANYVGRWVYFDFSIQ